MNTTQQPLQPNCGARHPDGFRCTEPEGHQGDHVAEGPDGPIVTWPQNHPQQVTVQHCPVCWAPILPDGSHITPAGAHIAAVTP